MGKTDIEKLLNYWKKTADYDYETMLSMYKTKRYAYCLFFGHLAIEKILKGIVVKVTKKQAPYTHDLIRLHKISKIKLDEAERDLLYQINDFNLRSRYPDAKLKFYKKATKEYAENYLDKIKPLYKKLCQKVKPKT